MVLHYNYRRKLRAAPQTGHKMPAVDSAIKLDSPDRQQHAPKTWYARGELAYKTVFPRPCGGSECIGSVLPCGVFRDRCFFNSALPAC